MEQQVKIVEISREESENAECWLKQHSRVEGHDILWIKTVEFEDELEADLKIVNAENGPFVEMVLFKDGLEIACCDAMTDIFEDEYFVSWQHECFKIIVIQED
jgi:hypothetical protein